MTSMRVLRKVGRQYEKKKFKIENYVGKLESDVRMYSTMY